MSRHFSEREIEDFRQCFSCCVRQGFVSSPEQLGFIMRSLGYSPTKRELTKYFNQYKGDDRVEFDQFLLILFEHRKVENCPKEILAAFEAYDKERKGYISARELRSVLTGYGEKLTDRDVDALLKDAGLSATATQIPYRKVVEALATPPPDY